MQLIKAIHKAHIPISLFENVQAGFPSPAEGLQTTLDLNEHLIKHPAATFFVRVAGDSMVDKGIFEGDLAVVDRSLDAKNGSIIIAFINSEFTIKEFYKTKQNQIILKSANTNYPHIHIKEDDEFEVWGVVTNIVRKI